MTLIVLADGTKVQSRIAIGVLVIEHYNPAAGIGLHIRLVHPFTGLAVEKVITELEFTSTPFKRLKTVWLARRLDAVKELLDAVTAVALRN